MWVTGSQLLSYHLLPPRVHTKGSWASKPGTLLWYVSLASGVEGQLSEGEFLGVVLAGKIF